MLTGVDDNGSGMVGMLFAADYISSYLSDRELTPNYTLIFVAFDFEEHVSDPDWTITRVSYCD